MTFTILPVMCEYVIAGEFTVGGRLCRAIKNNLFLYGLGLVGLVILVGILFTYEDGREALKSEGLISCLISLANAWGLFLIMILLGFGLSYVPKSFWKTSDFKHYSNFYLYRLAIYDDKLHSIKIKLGKTIRTARILTVTADLQPYLTEFK